MTKRIALVVYPGFQMISLAAMSVFEIANFEQPAPRYAVSVVSVAGGLVRDSAGIAVATEAIGRRRFDTVLVAGATRVVPTQPELAEALVRLASRVRRLGSICSGAFALADAGLLDGRRATTHWGQASALQQRHPGVIVEDDRIYVRDGSVWTSAGMTAGIDLALALVEADWGGDVARETSRLLVVHYRRTGGQSQFSTLSTLEPSSDRVRTALAYAREHLRESLSVEQLAAHVHWSARHFSREFTRQTGLTPAKAIEKLRLEAAQALLEAGEASIARVANVTGFGDEERMRRAFVRTLGKPPQALLREARERMRG
ncbi:GlxA family transcriptional regulator [Pandoraea pulmonicola]|uniref:AraC family transcriptional regulator n=1 Tax=Pandoraea pulmonicola TaxID=93221 RepID=A0AAJ4ZGH3_PANPU|nr:GlxA family transcriptional regulator [Pandoraea pulmonicola]AJC22802.1 AraC family transcriptional regulator [Pandoraea pulmonicola]SUA92907.1 L-rhamnose operon regulatory protein rhaS [Pandoraea pulmonicola]